jgi:TRAP-type uncharacterized transport system substrate-binding protein
MMLGKALELMEEGDKVAIPVQSYRRLPAAVPTLGSHALLVAGEDLTSRQAQGILSAIFDAREGEAGQEDLVKHHEAAEEIRLLTTLQARRTPLIAGQPRKFRTLMPFRFHPGARAFWDQEERKLKIAAGQMEGTSFRLGLEIAAALSDYGMPARVVNTDGDEESMKRLEDREVDLALLHNDVAAVGFAESPNVGVNRRTSLPDWVRQLLGGLPPEDPKGDMQLLSFLHPEAIHVLAALVPEQHRRRCPALCRTGQPRDFKQLLGVLIRQSSLTQKGVTRIGLAQLALADKEPVERRGDMPEDRDTLVLRHFGRLLHKEAVIGTAIHDDRLPRLSIAQAQNRLVTGDIAAVMVTSGVPMEAVQQLLTRKSIPRLARLAGQVPRCPYCGATLKDGQRLEVVLLPLRSDEPSRPSAPPTNPPPAGPPYSIQGLVANDRWFDSFVIPPHAYPALKSTPASTVAVKVVLVCGKKCRHVYDIVSALVEDEVRLRSIVRGINLHRPLLQEEDQPSIPVHPEAIRYYGDQGILQRLPPRLGLLWETIIPHLQTAAITFLLVSMWPLLRRRFGSWRARQQVAFQRRLRDAYFQELRYAYWANSRKRRHPLEAIETIWGQVLDAYGRRQLRPADAETLDKLARDYREYLQQEVAAMRRSHRRRRASVPRGP